MQRLQEFISSVANFRKKKKQQQRSTHRTVYNNTTLEDVTDREAPPQVKYKSNKIKTTKYSILTFLPKNLFEQFHRFANIYFLSITLLNWIPQINAFGKEMALVPVIAVLAITAIKDGIEDYRRYRQDVKVNMSRCLVYQRKTGSFEKTRWHLVRVGDIVKVHCNQVIPADLLLLSCGPGSNTCYIETANLDGESNLKQRCAVPPGGTFYEPTLKLKIECDVPNAELYQFHGTIQLDSSRKFLLTKDNLVLRGCMLRNTDYVEGIVVYTGHETKAMMNASGPRYKRSKLERLMNRDVLWCLVVLLFLCFFSAIGSGVWLGKTTKRKHKNDSGEYPDFNIPYIPFAFNSTISPAEQGVIVFWTFIIIYQVMIPLSLYATLEIVKVCQVYFIHQDIHLFNAETNSRPVCRALNITEDLGQVEHIFSDKTGTLTENKMVFRACVVGERLFREPTTNADDTQLRQDSLFDDCLEASVMTASANNYSGCQLTPEEQSRVCEFLILMATCNTVVVSDHTHNPPTNGLAGSSVLSESVNTLSTELSVSTQGAINLGMETSDSANTLTVPVSTLLPLKSALQKLGKRIRRSFADDLDEEGKLPSTSEMSVLSQSTLKSRYEAESPDELALVTAACSYGCRLLSRTSDNLTVYLPALGQIRYDVLVVIPFDSDRKCMSIVLKNRETSEISLYTKGADNIIFEKICDTHTNQQLLGKMRICVNHFAKDGLRTLCMARKILVEEEFDQWYSRYSNPDSDDTERAKMCRTLESGLDLLGATGIEDKLQDGVTESIVKLQEAGITVWVLTGDKQETAINIGYACGLMPQEAAILTINVENADDIEGVIQTHMQGLESASDHLPRCLVIDGQSLNFVFKGHLARSFLNLCNKCLSVLCCRTTPSQKAQVVEMVKEKSKKLTLAIGDGANDVNMIRTANIGVGIAGLEGRQASMAADFSISRYRHLVRLLLVHGHWCYDRLANMVLYNFFKNSNLIFVLFWYQIFAMFSGQVQIDQVYLVIFHLVFTSLPPIVMGVFDRDLPASVLVANPSLYRQGMRNRLYHGYSYWMHTLDSLYQSVIMFFVTYLHYRDTDIDIWSFGIVQVVAIVHTQLWVTAVDTRTWHWLYVVAQLLSIGAFWTLSMVLGSSCELCDPPSNPYWVPQSTLGQADAWLCIALTCVLCMIPRVFVAVMFNTLCPSEVIRARSRVFGTKPADCVSDVVRWHHNGIDHQSLQSQPEISNICAQSSAVVG